MDVKSKRSEMSEVERQQISRWRDEGESYTEIARRLVRPVNTVRDCALRMQKRQSVENAPRSGRPRKDNAVKRSRTSRGLCRKCGKGKISTTANLAKSSGRGNNISTPGTSQTHPSVVSTANISTASTSQIHPALVAAAQSPMVNTQDIHGHFHIEPEGTQYTEEYRAGQSRTAVTDVTAPDPVYVEAQMTM